MIEVGQTVGNYEVTAKLGEGAMGIVFLAQHPVIGSIVALKAIRPQFARNFELAARFVNEAKSVNQIRHHNIVDIIDFGVSPGGDFYFTMEYLQGAPLSASIKQLGSFPLDRTIHIVAQIAEALQASHEHGVIHRDLKPDNIFLIARDGIADFVKVLDFGLAKLTNNAALGTRNTAAGSLMGTPFYMAPEQCQGKPEIDHRADIYALGIILFEMLTGVVPFGGSGCGEILLKHISAPVPAASGMAPSLPLAFDAILARALAKDPEQRFQSMADFRAALMDVGASLSSASPSSSSPDAKSYPPLPSPLESAPTQPLDWQTSTFRGSVGMIEEGRRRPLPRRAVRRRAVAAAGLVAMAAVVLLGSTSLVFRRQAAAVRLAPVAAGPPATVRVDINSDPEDATVSQVDGTILGRTPLSLNVPYSVSPLQFTIQKAGYVTKETSLIPNLPSPILARLEKDDLLPAASTTAALPSEEASERGTSGHSRTTATTAMNRRPHVRAKSATHSQPRLPADPDDVLELAVY